MSFVVELAILDIYIYVCILSTFGDDTHKGIKTKTISSCQDTKMGDTSDWEDRRAMVRRELNLCESSLRLGSQCPMRAREGESLFLVPGYFEHNESNDSP